MPTAFNYTGALAGSTGMATRSVLLGVQTDFGTAVAPDIRPAFGLDADPQFAVTPVLPTGTRFAYGVMVGKETTRLAFANSQATYNDIVLILQSLMQEVTRSGGVYEFIPETFDADAYRLYTVDIGNSVLAARIPDVFMDSLSLTFAPTAAIGLTGNATGGVMVEEGITPNATPTIPPVVALQPKGTSVFVSDTLAGLDTADPIGDATTTLAYNNARNPFLANDTSRDSYSAITDLAPQLTGSFVIPQGTLGIEYMSWARAATTFFIRVRNTGPTVGGIAYEYEADACMAFNDNPGARGENQNRYAATFPLVGVYSEDLGGPIRVRVTAAAGL